MAKGLIFNVFAYIRTTDIYMYLKINIMVDVNTVYTEAGNYIYYWVEDGISRINKKTSIINDTVIYVDFGQMVQIGDFVYVNNLPNEDEVAYKKANVHTYEVTDNNEIFY